MFVFGGRICPFSGDIKQIKDDLELVKPSFFISVPRLYNRFYDAVK
jgi:long-chain acyl-CoA synthetase